jgi:hypothetical protein
MKENALEAISKMQITFKDKARPIRRRLKSYGGTGEKAESRQRRDEQYILRRSATP